MNMSLLTPKTWRSLYYQCNKALDEYQRHPERSPDVFAGPDAVHREKGVTSHKRSCHASTSFVASLFIALSMTYCFAYRLQHPCQQA